MNAQELEDDWDVIIVHDPQPAGLREQRRRRARSRWIWRCHIDLSTPNEETLARLLPLLRDYDETVYHMQTVRARGRGRQACGSSRRRSTRCRRRTWRSRPRTPPSSASSSGSTSSGR